MKYTSLWSPQWTDVFSIMGIKLKQIRDITNNACRKEDLILFFFLPVRKVLGLKKVMIISLKLFHSKKLNISALKVT